MKRYRIAGQYSELPRRSTYPDGGGRGEPADPITVSADLERRGELRRVGGAPYLHTLIATVPTAANAGFYAEIVAEKAILRRLIEAGTRIVQMGHQGADGGADVDEVVDRAQAAIYEVTERRTSEDYIALEELLQPTMDELEAIETRGLAFGVPTGFEDLDAVTNGLHAGQMIIIAARPGIGKSTLGLDIARSCSIRHGLASCIFSLEMSRTEIVMRLLAAEASIPLAAMRTGARMAAAAPCSGTGRRCPIRSKRARSATRNSPPQMVPSDP